MIICYEGTPGSGKSLDAVVKIIDNLRLGRTVYTNISGIDDPYCREHLKLKTGMDDYEISTRLIYLTDLEITDPKKHCKPGSLIVIDEVHKRLNARDWQTAKNKEFADWGSTHRHGGFDVVLITQGLEKVDSQVRGLVEFTHRYKKNNYFGSLFESKYLVKVYEEDSNKIIGRRSGSYDPSIFKCYKSYVAGDIKEMKIQANVNILKHPIFYALPVMLLLTGYMFMKSSFASGDLFGTKKRLDTKKTVLVQNKAVPVVPAGVKVQDVKSEILYFEKKPIPKKPAKKPGSPSVGLVPVAGKVYQSVVPSSAFPIKRPSVNFTVMSSVSVRPVLASNDRVDNAGFGCSGGECFTIVDGRVVAVKE